MPGNTITPNPDTLKKYNADVYDDASDIYDTYEGLFFPYLFGRIRELVADRFIPSLPNDAVVLDVGCGTGQQTLLFREKGIAVVGVDISAGLVRVANEKIGENICMVSDACRLPFVDGVFDAVSCAGSTLNHIPDYGCFFDEVARVLKPGGYIFLESDNKWRPDMFWCLLSCMAGDPLQYHEKLGHVIGYFKRPLSEGYPYVFPLSFGEGKVRELNLRTFTCKELYKELGARGCKVEKVYGIHAITNVLPSPLMIQDHPGKITTAVFKFLAFFENRLYGLWPINRVGMSVIVFARKNAPK
ncbi:class I SAM-dependent methyltransferase [Methanocella arvoryzae]|uniref:Predicted methyltransferase (UbiE/COQ5 family) n=1 Tax=Methanocella arvoryzae (strain DSM 22066 / NBRC 105507 / MRE50) TaxID=351160 RepID=Q05HF2_METAR|nr:class I SAM-dependent methyltransferase [Methanocella arvoryzae]CAL59662.1 predicted methyltransferase (UbiE/COQ5 family) [Methanocella arvoryzae MRE50]